MVELGKHHFYTHIFILIYQMMVLLGELFWLYNLGLPKSFSGIDTYEMQIKNWVSQLLGIKTLSELHKYLSVKFS